MAQFVSKFKDQNSLKSAIEEIKIKYELGYNFNTICNSHDIARNELAKMAKMQGWVFGINKKKNIPSTVEKCVSQKIIEAYIDKESKTRAEYEEILEMIRKKIVENCFVIDEETQELKVSIDKASFEAIKKLQLTALSLSEIHKMEFNVKKIDNKNKEDGEIKTKLEDFF